MCPDLGKAGGDILTEVRGISTLHYNCPTGTIASLSFFGDPLSDAGTVGVKWDMAALGMSCAGALGLPNDDSDEQGDGGTGWVGVGDWCVPTTMSKSDMSKSESISFCTRI